MKKDIELCGQEFSVSELNGVVSDIQRWSNTYSSTTTSGGGGYIHNGSGNVSPTTTTTESRTVVTQRIFVELSNGRDWHFDTGENFAARKGNAIRARFIDDSLVLCENLNNGATIYYGVGDHIPRNYNILVSAGLGAATVLSGLYVIEISFYIHKIDRILGMYLPFGIVFFFAAATLLSLPSLWRRIKILNRMKGKLKEIIYSKGLSLS